MRSTHISTLSALATLLYIGSQSGAYSKTRDFFLEQVHAQEQSLDQVAMKTVSRTLLETMQKQYGGMSAQERFTFISSASTHLDDSQKNLLIQKISSEITAPTRETSKMYALSLEKQIDEPFRAEILNELFLSLEKKSKQYMLTSLLAESPEVVDSFSDALYQFNDVQVVQLNELMTKQVRYRFLERVRDKGDAALTKAKTAFHYGITALEAKQ